MIFLKTSVTTLCLISLAAHGQSRVKTKDSIAMKNQIEEFYSWYINKIKTNTVNSGFNPRFVRRQDGMTTLDFKTYKRALTRFKFTEDYIQRKINEYNECNDNLRKISFDSFSKYTDLDDFENIKCDFSNRYEWIGGQEPKDKAELLNLKPMGKNIVAGSIHFISNGKQDGRAWVIFKKSGSNWKVDNVELE